jgi:acyl-CoA synthetase (AMP-forming)/AMP-acid ligase II
MSHSAAETDGTAQQGGTSGTGPGMNLADVWEAVARTVPDAPALVHGPLVRSWEEFESRSASLAAHLGAHGVGHDDKLACYLYNGPEYLEATFAAFKARAVPINVNYRYLDAELTYLLDNADARAVVFDVEFAERLERVRPSLPSASVWVCVGSDTEHPCPDWASPYEDVIATTAPAAPVERSGDDLWFLYTGGTTGMPKGVMWPQANLLQTAAATFAVVKHPVPSSADDVVAAVREFHDRGRAVRLLPAAPLMHGTSAITAVAVLSAGGTVVTLTERSFDADELCEAVQAHRVTQLTIVGDAFAKPIVAALRRARDAGRPYEMSSLKVIVSSGVMWSAPAKEELLEFCSATLVDTLGSSEGVGFASSIARKGERAPTARFSLGEHARVFTEAGDEVAPGSGERGLLAVGGPIPIGYYKDPDKTAGTFRTFDGRVWSVPGDWATVEPDGTIQLLGRGSVCINTAGEKVYPEEVEEVLKLHDAVLDCNVVGLPDEKWGQSVTAVVSLVEGLADPDDRPDGAALIAHAKEHLAGYKCPKRVVLVEAIQRGPNGKPDYRWAAEVATAADSTSR